VRLNLGGPAVAVGAVRWAACATAEDCGGATLAGGRASALRAAPRIAGVAAPAPSTLYASAWSGRRFALALPVADGAYLVRLHAAETGSAGLGERRFDVDLEGGRDELRAFDVVAEAGARRRAVVRELGVTVRDGRLDLEVVRRTGDAALSAVEVLPVAAAPAARASTLSLTARAGRLTGALTAGGALAGRRVVLERRTGGRWGAVAVARTGRAGTFRLHPAQAGAFRARFAGDARGRPAVSAARRLAGAGS
jgi:hypothetical protein